MADSNPNSIMNLDPKAFTAALDEWGIQGDERNRLVGMYRDQTMLGQAASALHGDVGEGMVRRSILPIAAPQGMTGAEAIMNGDFEWAVPGMISSLYQAPADALATYDASVSGLPVSQEEFNQKMMDMGAVMAGSSVMAKPVGRAAQGIAELVDNAQLAQRDSFAARHTPSQDVRPFAGAEFYEPSPAELLRMKSGQITPEELDYWNRLLQSDSALASGATPREASLQTDILRFPRVNMQGQTLGAPREVQAVTTAKMTALRPERANLYGAVINRDQRPDLKGISGYFDETKNPPVLWVNPNDKPMRQIATERHETQHITEKVSGVPKGERGSHPKKTYYDRLDALDGLASRIRQSKDPVERAKLREQFTQLRRSTPRELYYRNPGEMSANITANNIKMLQRLNFLETLNPYLNAADKGPVRRGIQALTQAAWGETTPWVTALQRKGLLDQRSDLKTPYAYVPMDISKAVIGNTKP